MKNYYGWTQECRTLCLVVILRGVRRRGHTAQANFLRLFTDATVLYLQPSPVWGFPPCFKHDSQVSEVSPGGSEGNSLLSGPSHLCCRLSPHNLCFTFSCHRELHLQLTGRRASQRHLPTPQTSLRLQCLLSPRHGVSCSSWAVTKSGDLFLVMNFCKRCELRVCAAPLTC